MEESIELIQDECVSENADRSTEDLTEGGPDADGEEMADGVEAAFTEDGGHELVGTKRWVPTPCGNSTACQQLVHSRRKMMSLELMSFLCAYI